MQLTQLGLLCGAISALLYTITNICLRQLEDVDIVWVSAIKALPTLIVVAPLVAWSASQGKQNFTSKSDAAWLIATSLCVQILGNVGFQFALSVLGLTISVPIVLGAMLVGGALIGKWVLGEPIGMRKVVSIILLIIATIALSYGAQSQTPPAESDSNVSVSLVTLALIANVLSGLAYAVLGTMLRKSMQSGMSLPATLFVISTVGCLLLVGWSYFRLGVEGMLTTTREDLWFMIAAGVFNAAAYFAMAKSLKELPVLYVQILNASQAAISAAAGWYFFQESLTNLVLLGLALTAAGMIVAGLRPSFPMKNQKEEVAVDG